MSQENNIVAGRYELLELIGRGGMGDVFKGRDTRTGELVAIKALHEHIVNDNPDIVDRFRREGEALGQLDHPNIVKLLDTVEESDRHYLVMEYVSGGSLRDLMDDQGQLPIDAVLNVALDLADALTRAHRMNVIHRDIKPDNVLLAEDGTPRLTDFGVAHLGDRTRLTETGSVIGTYAYLSPEACEGQELDPRTDIWSFGIMLYEMIAGRPPFQAAGTAAILTAILTKPAPDLKRLRPNTPDALVNLIRQMLEKNRNDRISSVRLVGAQIEAIISNQDTPLRNALRAAGVGPGSVDRSSRFVTPQDESDERKRIPAMMSTPDGQPHGFSHIYPAQEHAGGTPPPSMYTGGYPMMTPGGTPITGEYPPANNFRWVALIAVALITAISAILIVAIISGAVDDSDTASQDRAEDPEVLPASEVPPVQVEPVAPGEHMVLVAALEPLGAEPGDVSRRDVSRFIVDNLQQELERGVSFSTVRVRAYPGVITSAEEAQTLAQEAGATVVIWGSYTADAIQLDVQIGVTDAFPGLVVPLEQVAEVANVRVSMVDERRESVAQQVLGVLACLHSGSGDIYEFMRTLAVMAEIDSPDAEPVGDSVATYAHRYFAGYARLSPDEIDLIERAIDKNAANPLLYALQAVAYLRQGDFAAANRAAETAGRLGPGEWVAPFVIAANSTGSTEGALELLDQVLMLRPDDWYAYSSRAMVYYQTGDYDRARSDLEQAIALEPEANFPYALAGLIAMNRGDFAGAFGYIETILSQFPDPDLYARIVGATVGGHDTMGPVVSAFINMSLGRYEEVLSATQTGIERNGPTSDLLSMEGLAYCNLDQPAKAESAYNQSMAQIDPADPVTAFMLLLRGDVRLQQDNLPGAVEDFTQAESMGVLPVTLVEAFRAGQANCSNYFNVMAMHGAIEAGQPLTESALPQVEPVEPGELMVLVAELEALDGIGSLAGHHRNSTGVLVDDLIATLEQAVPFSTIRVRTYPQVITTDAEALAAAQASGAAVVVWGNTSSDLTEIEVQVGDLGAFPHMAFERRVLERTVNVRIRLSGDTLPSIAPQVLGVLQVLELADGNSYETMRISAIRVALASAAGEENTGVDAAAIMGNSVAANVQRFSIQMLSDPAGALVHLDAALALDAGNPLLYAYRAVALQRMGRFEESRVEIESAERTGPEGWAMPAMLRAYISPTDEVFQLFDEVIAARPEDWFPVFFRGTSYYWAGDYARADADLQLAITLNPNANFPYVYAALLAFRTGQWAEAGETIRTILQEFPDPFYMERLITATFGDEMPNPYDLLLSAFTYQAMGRYAEAAEQAGRGAALYDGMSDFNFLQGVALCAQGKAYEAEVSLSNAVYTDPDFALAHLLRAALRLQIGREAGAELDLKAVELSAQGASFAPYVEAVRDGSLRCENLFDPSDPIYQLGGGTTAATATATATAPLLVEPVEPGQIMILVAEFESLDVSSETDVTRFVADNLALAFEDELPNSSFRVRRYPAVIASDDGARAAAEANGAPVIVWGNYTTDLIEVEVQVGTLDALPYFRFDRDVMERVANVRVHLTDARRQSVALQVANILNLMTAADGDEIAFFLTLAVVDSLEAEGGELAGSTLAAAMHHAVALMADDPAAAKAAFSEAVTLGASSPFPYLYRALVALRLGETDQLREDVETARRLGPHEWTGPLYLSMALMTTSDEVMAASDQLVMLRPNDWYAWETRAVWRYYASAQPDYTLAVNDLARAMALRPTTGTPFLFSALIALRQGRITDAQTFMQTLLREYPDPQILNRAMRTLYGTERGDFRGLLVEYGTNLMLGRYSALAEEIAEVVGSLEPAVVLPQAEAMGDNLNDLGDLLLLGGLAQCAQGQASEAAVTFGLAAQLSPDYTLLAVLRAQALAQSADDARTAEQWALAEQHAYGPAFDPWLAAAQAGEWTCVNFFDFQP